VIILYIDATRNCMSGVFGDVPIPIGEAVGALEHRLPVAGKEHGTGERAGRCGGIRSGFGNPARRRAHA
jgi:hypothetical protein